jgi:predicted transcriptional regulator
MAFYIVVKGKLTPFQFDYLDDSNPIRLERTLIHGDQNPKGKNKSAQEDLQKEVFAIEVMTSKIITLSPAAKIKDAKELMEKSKISHIPLLIDKLLTGMISKRDIPTNASELEGEIRLDKVMSKMVLCSSETTPLRHIAQVFLKENINSLPVVDSEFAVTGIITHRDLIRWLLDNQKFQR